jgi:hypothetical protein
MPFAAATIACRTGASVSSDRDLPGSLAALDPEARGA